MIKNKKLVIILLILILIVAFIGVRIIGVKKENARGQSASELNLATLQQTDFASKAFTKVKIGDTLDQVQSKMGELEKLEDENDYNVYKSADEQTQYYFYFKDDILNNVSLRAV